MVNVENSNSIHRSNLKSNFIIKKSEKSKAKVIQDPIHGNISIEDWVIELIDTPPIQRLRRIKQLGFANLVYPGANHSRFEHSIGVMYIANLLTERVDLPERDKKEIIAAALLHDVGHPPFSHTTDKILQDYIGSAHEEIDNISGTEIEDVFKEEGIRKEVVFSHIRGTSEIGIVNGDIDADRMDYLVRDSHYTGVAHGIFDLMRLLNKICFCNNGRSLVIDCKGLRAAESLLISRFLMYPTVYFHHVCRIAEKMYERALEFCIDNNQLEPDNLLKMDDYDVVAFLRGQKGFPAEIMSQIDRRDLMKRAVYVSAQRIGMDVRRIKSSKAVLEISEMAGVPPEYVFVDIPPLGETRELSALVKFDNEFIKLENASPILEALKKAHREVWKLGVYTPEKYRKKVSKASAEYFEIDNLNKQKRLDEVLPIW